MRNNIILKQITITPTELEEIRGALAYSIDRELASNSDEILGNAVKYLMNNTLPATITDKLNYLDEDKLISFFNKHFTVLQMHSTVTINSKKRK